MRKTDVGALLVLISTVSTLSWTGKPPVLPTRDFTYALAPPQDLNGKSLAELAALRQAGFERQPEMNVLVPAAYPFEERPAWREVDTQAEWPAIYLRSKGESSASFCLLNPYLLATLEPSTYINYDFHNPPGEAQYRPWQRDHYPRQAQWQGGDRTLKLKIYQRRYETPYLFRLQLINARDMGYEGFAIPKSASQGIVAAFDKM